MADFKFSCPNCDQHIACDTGYAGMQINCPTCKQAIVVPQAPVSAAPPTAPRSAAPPPPPSLAPRQSTAVPAAGQRFAGAPGAQPPPKAKSKALRNILIITAAIVVLAVLGAGGWFGYSKFKAVREAKKENPAAQVTAPTAAATVQALSILTKVRSAYTNLANIRVDGTLTAFLNLSNITVADVSPNLPANAKNANRHPQGMPRIITNTTEFSVRRSGTNLYYIAGEAISKIDRQNMTNTFAFWKSDKGQFTFMDSHQRGISASYRQLPDVNPANGQAEQFKNIQQLFADPANLTKIIKDLGQTADEPVNGQDCYTLTAKVLGQKVKIWVNKNTYLIPQWQITLGGEISDADVDDAFSLFAAGFTNVPPAQLDMIKTQVEKRTPVMMKIRGTITSTSRDIELNPTFAADDFNYDVPPGVRLIPVSAANSTSAASRLAVNQRNACINNLRQIDSAKQEWALEKGKGPNATPTEDDLKPYLGHGPNGSFPVCPSGGKYTIGKVSEKPTCSIPGHELP